MQIERKPGNVPGAATIALVCALGTASGVAPAQAPPGISDLLRQVSPPQPAQKPEPALPALRGIEAAPPLRNLPGEKIDVKKLEISGNRAIASEVLHGLVRSAEGRSLTLRELEGLAASITQYYRGAGYFVARAYLPAQEVRDGVVSIRVIEGRYGKFILENKSLVRDGVVQGLLDDVKDRDIVSNATLERAMLLINDTPGAVITRADVLAGDQPGTSDFIVGTGATSRVTGHATLDNHGSAHTGRNRLLAGLEILSPSGLGDKLSASGLVTNSENLTNYRVAYSTLLASSGLRGEAGLSKTSYQLTGIFAALDAVGQAETLEVTLAYPFKRTQSLTLEGSFNLGHRKLTDEIRSTATVTPKTADVATLSFRLTTEDRLWGLFGRTAASAAATLGDLDIREATARSLDAAGAGTQGRFGKINLAVNRMTRIAPRWTLSTSFRMQKALYGKNLDGSEDMWVSGMSGVKAYPSGELAAENAYLLTAELQHGLPLEGPLGMRLGLFADAGRASMQNPFGGATPRSLSDVGIGIYANYLKFFAVLQVAMRTGSPATSEAAGRTRAFLQVGTSF